MIILLKFASENRYFIKELADIMLNFLKKIDKDEVDFDIVGTHISGIGYSGHFFTNATYYTLITFGCCSLFT